MLQAILRDAEVKTVAERVPERGYLTPYVSGETNICPRCGGRHWYVGRTSAECGFCGTAMPLADAAPRGTAGFSRGHSRPAATSRTIRAVEIKKCHG